jgi:hypothetical protein
MNHAFFEKLYTDTGGVVGTELTAPVGTLVKAQRAMARGGRQSTGDNNAALLVTALKGGVSSRAAMVELTGFEPVTSCMPCKRSTN